MRLTPSEQQRIIHTFHEHFGKADHLWLFGSRVDDKKRGGDIDLYIQTPEENYTKLMKQRRDFIIALEDRIGEQKIDVVIHQLKDKTDLPIYHVAQKMGILLA